MDSDQAVKTPDLKPCPFCGKSYFITRRLAVIGAAILCTACGASGPHGVNEKGAIAAWNTGTPDPVKTPDLESLCERLNKWAVITACEDPFLDGAEGAGKTLYGEAASALYSLQARVTELTTERDSLREMVPTPLNAWGAKGYEVAYSREGPGATPRWCLHLNGVGSIPLAWFYRKADAERVVAAEARITELEGERDEARRVCSAHYDLERHWNREYHKAQAQVREAVDMLERLARRYGLLPYKPSAAPISSVWEGVTSLLQRLKSTSLEGDLSAGRNEAPTHGQ